MEILQQPAVGCEGFVRVQVYQHILFAKFPLHILSPKEALMY